MSTYDDLIAALDLTAKVTPPTMRATSRLASSSRRGDIQTAL